MLKKIKIFGALLLIAVIGFLTKSSLKHNYKDIIDFLMDKGLILKPLNEDINSQNKVSVDMDDSTRIFRSENVIITPNDILGQGNGILFVETTDRMDEPSLVLCSIESAARMYPDRPVGFFMKGLNDVITEEDERKAREHFPTLSSYKNIYIFPLRLEKLFADTPFLAWYKKVDPNKEIYWIHVKSDACRFALMWKYGGIYMDTDVISIRPIPENHFLAAESFIVTSSSVFGLSPHHNMTREFMENFVQNYRGEIWGHQGPGVFTRVVRKHCGMPQFKSVDHVKCENITYFHPTRFYPITHPYWTKYFEVWSELPTFNDSYALHLWNFNNKNRQAMVPKTNTLVEHLYQQYCPSTYEAILNKKLNYH